jgi:hypothetical protein
MKKYKFDLLKSTITGYHEKDFIIPANSLSDAITKFVRKHELEEPAYWDEPFFDKHIELTFKSIHGEVNYNISW